LPPSSGQTCENINLSVLSFQIILATVLAVAAAAPSATLLHAPGIAYAAPAIHGAPLALAAPVVAAPVVKTYAAPVVAAPVVKAYGHYGGHYW